MYNMKVLLHYFWLFKKPERAEEFLSSWCHDAMTSGITPLVRLAKTIGKYQNQILNYFNYHITNAVVEGTNNKIKTLKRQAYGYRDLEYFKLRLYHLHCTGYSFAG
jgi:transposase